MNLINTDGMAIFGPGSEWFWSMLQFVVVAITLCAIYRQLGAQRSTSLFEQMTAWTREWEEDRFSRTRLRFLIDIEHRDPAQGLPESSFQLANFFERLGYLVSHGHFRREDVYQALGTTIVWHWMVMKPYLEATRRTGHDPRRWEWFDWLARTMRKVERQSSGREMVVDPTVPGQRVADRIDNLTANFRQEQDAKAGIIPSRPTPPAPATAE